MPEKKTYELKIKLGARNGERKIVPKIIRSAEQP